MTNNSYDTINALYQRVQKLENAIRKHRDASGHDLCWENDIELWSVLDGECVPRKEVPSWCDFIQNCAKYRASLDQERKPDNSV